MLGTVAGNVIAILNATVVGGATAVVIAAAIAAMLNIGVFAFVL